MALSSCPKCEAHQFELKENKPIGSHVSIQLVQCTACGAVVGTVPVWDTAALLDTIAKKLGIHDLLS